MKELSKHFELTISRARYRHHMNILLCYGILIFIATFLFILVRNNTKNATGFWWESIIFYSALLIVTIILIIIALRYNISSIIRILDARLVTKENGLELLKSVNHLASKAGVPEPSVYITDKECITILSGGWTPKNSIVVLSSKVIDALKKDELDSLIAHEICHIRSYDYLSRVALFISFGILFMLCHVTVLNCISNSKELLNKVKNSGKWHILLSDRSFIYLLGLLIMGPFLFFFAWIIGTPLRKIIIEQEYKADLGSVQITGDFSSLASAITKLSSDYQNQVNTLTGFFVLFDIVRFSHCKKVQQECFGFFQRPIMARVAKRAEKLNDIKNLFYDATFDNSKS